MKFDLGMNLKIDVDLTEGNNKCKKGCEKEVDQFPLFSFSSVSSATGNFSAANKLGEGGFGTVYKVSFHLYSLQEAYASFSI